MLSGRYAGRIEFIQLDHPGFHAPTPILHLLWPLNVVRFIERAAHHFRGVDGVIGTDEFLGCGVAAGIARLLGLPGPSPEAVLRCQHKYYSRVAQGPYAVPFTLVNPFNLRPPELAFPLFVKPVRGTTSVFARRVDSFDDLRAFLNFSTIERFIGTRVLHTFNQMLAHFTTFHLNANYFLAEQLLHGDLVTVEGFVCRGRPEIIGITDSIMYPGTMSFMRFDYPSRLPLDVQQRMTGIAGALALRLGLDDTLFNVEMFHDDGAIHVVEVNPRMAYQFADLYEKVDGMNSYDIQVALALGEEPKVVRGRGPYGRASSFVFRKFEDARIVRMPDPARVTSIFPDARVMLYGRPGDRLSQQKGVESYRYAVMNLGGRDERDLFARFQIAERELEFIFE